MVPHLGGARLVLPPEQNPGEIKGQPAKVVGPNMSNASILIQKLDDRFVKSVSSLQSPFLLVVRVYWGCQLSQTGWGKLKIFRM